MSRSTATKASKAKGVGSKKVAIKRSTRRTRGSSIESGEEDQQSPATVPSPSSISSTVSSPTDSRPFTVSGLVRPVPSTETEAESNIESDQSDSESIHEPEEEKKSSAENNSDDEGSGDEEGSSSAASGSDGDGAEVDTGEESEEITVPGVPLSSTVLVDIPTSYFEDRVIERCVSAPPSSAVDRTCNQEWEFNAMFQYGPEQAVSWESIEAEVSYLIHPAARGKTSEASWAYAKVIQRDAKSLKVRMHTLRETLQPNVVVITKDNVGQHFFETQWWELKSGRLPGRHLGKCFQYEVTDSDENTFWTYGQCFGVGVANEDIMDKSRSIDAEGGRDNIVCQLFNRFDGRVVSIPSYQLMNVAPVCRVSAECFIMAPFHGIRTNPSLRNKPVTAKRLVYPNSVFSSKIKNNIRKLEYLYLGTCMKKTDFKELRLVPSVDAATGLLIGSPLPWMKVLDQLGSTNVLKESVEVTRKIAVIEPIWVQNGIPPTGSLPISATKGPVVGSADWFSRKSKGFLWSHSKSVTKGKAGLKSKQNVGITSTKNPSRKSSRKCEPSTRLKDMVTIESSSEVSESSSEGESIVSEESEPTMTKQKRSAQGKLVGVPKSHSCVKSSSSSSTNQVPSSVGKEGRLPTSKKKSARKSVVSTTSSKSLRMSTSSKPVPIGSRASSFKELVKVMENEFGDEWAQYQVLARQRNTSSDEERVEDLSKRSKKSIKSGKDKKGRKRLNHRHGDVDRSSSSSSSSVSPVKRRKHKKRKISKRSRSRSSRRKKKRSRRKRSTSESSSNSSGQSSSTSLDSSSSGNNSSSDSAGGNEHVRESRRSRRSSKQRHRSSSGRRPSSSRRRAKSDVKTDDVGERKQGDYRNVFRPPSEARRTNARLFRSKYAGMNPHELVKFLCKASAEARFTITPGVAQSLYEGLFNLRALSITHFEYVSLEKKIARSAVNTKETSDSFGSKVVIPGRDLLRTHHEYSKACKCLRDFAIKYFQRSAVTFCTKLCSLVEEMEECCPCTSEQQRMTLTYWINTLCETFFRTFSSNSKEWQARGRHVTANRLTTSNAEYIKLFVTRQPTTVSKSNNNGGRQSTGQASTGGMVRKLSSAVTKLAPTNNANKTLCLKLISAQGCGSTSVGPCNGNSARHHWLPEALPTDLIQGVKSSLGGMKSGYRPKQE